jgi:signal transduction histidine kinase
MSHEMRTPMHAIMGMMQVIMARGVPDPIKGNFNRIDAASRHLLQLIDDLLDVSAMEYGALVLLNETFSFAAMMKDIIQKTMLNISAKQQVFSIKVDPLIPVALTGDEKRLKQVIFSFLSNAVKFTPAGGEVNLDVRLLHEDDTSALVQFNIADTGIGISDEQMTGLFNLFEQADGTTTRKHGGIGVGLALSKRIIELMDGTITVTSEVDRGSRFVFTCRLNKTES